MPSLRGLVVGAVAATDDFSVCALRWHPSFDVVFFGCYSADVACADVDYAVGNFEFLEKFFRVVPRVPHAFSSGLQACRR